MATAKDLLLRTMAWPGPENPGFVNLHWWSPGKDEPDKKFWSGKPFQDVDSFLSFASWALKQPTIKDLYYCLSLQKNHGTNKTTGKPNAIRSAANALNLKCFYVDIDIKEEPKGYPSLPAALTALTAFCHAKGIPPPTALVASGGGLHVYWTLDKPISPDVWQPYANGLKGALLDFGLHCDAGCTIDSARLFRVPQTINHKFDPPKPVRVLALQPEDYTLEQLAVFKTFTSASVTPLATWGDGTLIERRHAQVESLADGITTEQPPLDPRNIFKECAFFRDALKTGGRDYGQSEWMYTTLAATWMENGEQFAHAMAKGHPEYTPEATQAMWERKLRDRRERGIGWPSCKTIQAAGCGSCAACPHLAKDKSPLNLALSVPATPDKKENASGLHDLPEGYVYEDDIICKLVEEKTGKGGPSIVIPRPLFHSVITRPWVHKGNPDTMGWTTSYDKGNTFDASITQPDIMGHNLGMTLMSSNCRTKPIPSSMKYMQDFLMAWLDKMHEEEEAMGSVPYGWHYDEAGEVAGFSYAGNLYDSKGGTRRAGAIHPATRQIWQPHGRPEPWFEAHNMIMAQGSPALECIMALAFASPLMEFAAQDSALMCAVGETGCFKSTALYAGLSIWGNPKLGKDKPSSTVIGLEIKMGQLNNLPIYWDELQEQEDMKKALKMVFEITSGVGRSRGNQKLENAERNSWRNLMCICSNNSITEFISSKQRTTEAGLMRTLEIRVPKIKGGPGIIDDHKASAITMNLERHNGHMGEAYAKHLAVHHEKVKRLVEDETADLRQRLTDLTGSQLPPERFWKAICATILAGARTANELGCGFHIEEMRNYLIGEYVRNRGEVADGGTAGGSESNTEAALSEYLKERDNQSIWTASYIEPEGPGRPRNIETIEVIHGLPNNAWSGVVVQWCRKERLLRVSRPNFRKWLLKNEYQPKGIIEGLVNNYDAVVKNGMLGYGSQYASSREKIINIPVSAAFAPMLDRYTSQDVLQREADKAA